MFSFSNYQLCSRGCNMVRKTWECTRWWVGEKGEREAAEREGVVIECR